MLSSASRPRRRAAPRWAGVVAIFAVIYAVVVALYAASGQVDISGDTDGGTSGQKAVSLTLTPRAVDAVGNRLSMDLELQSPGSLASDADASLKGTPITVVVGQNDGPRTVDFSSSQFGAPVNVKLITDGYVEKWPFDTYHVTTWITAVHEVDGEVTPVETVLFGAGRVPGWNIDAHTVDTGQTYEVDGVRQKLIAVSFTATRSPSTIAFAIVLLVLMIVMPVLVLVVAITVFRGRRKVEATVMSWIGAMLFATIPLRNFLPGSPPIGSWVDYVVVLWVIAALIAGLVIFVISWLRLGPAGDPAPVTATPDSGEPVEERAGLTAVDSRERTPQQG